MDHKNLEYFSTTTKLLTYCQVHWLGFLCQFNLTIHFCPSCLGTKPDMLTRQWDIYPKEGGSDYASVNLHNLHPVFTQEQLASSLHTTFLSVPTLHAAIIMDIEKLCPNIHSSLCSDLITSTQLDSPSPHWSINSKGFLLLEDKIYIPNTSNL